ncbi:MAG: hypothetical protein ACPGJS_00725 [Flammeovirgaceae bacterium]
MRQKRKNRSQKSIYRKWNDDGEEHYLVIRPGGQMIEIKIFEDELYGTEVSIYKTRPQSPLDFSVMIKYKEVAKKQEFIEAQKRAKALLKID